MAVTHSKGWVTGIPGNPEDAVIYMRMAAVLARQPYALGRVSPNTNYSKACMLYLLNDWDEFMHKDERDEALIPFRKLASVYRIRLS